MPGNFPQPRDSWCSRSAIAATVFVLAALMEPRTWGDDNAGPPVCPPGLPKRRKQPKQGRGRSNIWE